MFSMREGSRRAGRRTWGLEALEDRRLMTFGPVAQFAPGWGDAVDVRFERYTTGYQESAGVVPITITRGGDLSLGAGARVRTATVDALEGYDYVGLDQAVTFAPGSATATFYLTILDDDVSEPVAKALNLQVYQTSDVRSDATVTSMMVLIGDDEAGSQTPLTFHAFGDAGLWTYNEAEGYRKINDASPEAIYPAPNRGAYLDFGAAGLWSWDALRGYEKLSDSDPQAVLTSIWGESLLIDFGHGGLWTWSRAGGCTLVTDVDPRQMAGSAESGLVDFGDAGLWSFSPEGWEKLDDQAPEAIVSAGGTYYVDYGARGLWQASVSQLFVLTLDGCFEDWRTTLTQVNPADPTSIAVTNAGLVVGFGPAGLWRYDGSWARINDVAPRATWAATDGLYLDYGDAGFWRLADGAWAKLSDFSPAAVQPFDPVGDAIHQRTSFDLDYGDAGLWRWSSATGWKKLSSCRVTAMGTARNDTGVQYGIIPA